ncbi:MAG: PAC2 family protein [Thermodesulfobacteriota bacterium]
MEKVPVEIYQSPNLDHPMLLVGWQTQDVGKLASTVIHFLNQKMGGRRIAELNPLGFYSFGGVRFKRDLIQIPTSDFWAYEKKNLLVFKSDEPEFEYYRFLNTVLEWTESRFQTKEVTTLNGIFSLIAHTQPRRIFVVFNQEELRDHLQGYDLEPLTWEGPPALSSYLLWIARRKGLSGMSLWVEIPFYLAATEDPRAIWMALSFLNRRFSLDLDLSEFASRIRNQEVRIARLRESDSEVDDFIRRLESGLVLNEEEQLKLTRAVYDVLTRDGCIE